jgi:hypothetical protein
VGEEQRGLETVLEVEDDGGWKRFWGRDKSIFPGQGARGRIEAERWTEICGFLKLVHAARRNEGGERSRI